MDPRNFFAELKRRNVYKVAVAYAVIAWLLIQAGSILFPTFEAPGWVMKVFVTLIAAGFVIALIIAWAFEMTPQGMKRTGEVSPGERLPYWSRRKFLAVIASIALAAGALYLFQLYRASPASARRGSADPPPAEVPEKSIAVLPFENLSRDPENAYFANGIQDEILTRLAKIDDLKVISRTSTLRYKTSPGNLPAIAKELGVAHVLEGSVQKTADQVRVTVQLIRAASDAHLWAETYDRKLTDIFAVESEIAESIARALRAKLTPQEQRAVTARPTDNPAAYEEYLRGVALGSKLTAAPHDLADAVTHFSRAVELDPKFVLAWSLLSVAHTFVYAESERTPQQAARAKESLEQAKRLQPDLGEVHFAEAMYRYRVLREYDEALASFEKARQRSANRSVAAEFAAYVKRRQGKWEEAVRLHEEALELDPRNPILLSETAVTYRAVRRFQETDAVLDRAREIEPENPSLLVQKVEAAAAQGNLEQAGRFLEQIPLDSRQPLLVNARFNYHLFTRKPAEAVRMMRQLLETEISPRLAVHYRSQLGIAETLAGNAAVAQAELARARDELLSLRAEGDTSERIGNSLLPVFALLGDKEGVEREAALMQDEISSDVLIGPILETTIAAARAQVGQTDVALASIKQLLQKPGEDALTPALLRLDPRWDAVRSDARFQELSSQKQP
jgi:TolB-like protein/Tfp pilus assembly protein PilF